jgi:hypothetical protein
MLFENITNACTGKACLGLTYKNVGKTDKAVGK